MRLAACKENPELLNCPLSLRQAKRQGKFRLPFNVNKSDFCEVGLDGRRTDRLYRHASRDISFPAMTKQKWRQENARCAWFLTRTFDLLTLKW